MPSSLYRPLPLCSALTLSLLLGACGAKPAAEEAVNSTIRELDVAGIVKMREEKRSVDAAEDPMETPIDQHDQVQTANLTAGDYDDILNPDLYVRYASAVAQQDGSLPFVDTRSRVAVRVVDAVGRAVPQARIDVARPGGTLHLVTGADGSASFYPRYDRAGTQARISISSEAGTASRTVQLKAQGIQNVMLTVPGRGHPIDALDLVLVLDTTGSMGDEMAYLQAELSSILARLKRDAGNLDIRVGLVVYRDRGDAYVTRSFPLSGDIPSVQSILDQQQAGGGGDMPEAVDRALIEAGRMQWRPEAAKAVLLVADAPPHSEALDSTIDAVETLREQGVRIVPVAASGVEDSAQYVMRAMAVLTEGRYIFLTDDSGIGNSHAEPDVSCYVVTRLDQMIARVLAGIVQGRRIEPAQGEIIRTVGDYDAGRCERSQFTT